jgi:hypothetical protein
VTWKDDWNREHKEQNQYSSRKPSDWTSALGTSPPFSGCEPKAPDPIKQLIRFDLNRVNVT